MLDTHPEHALGEDKRTGRCPDGHGLLRRARVTFHTPYFLERCARCGGVWFDAGEWSRAAADGLLANLSEVWSPAWRKQLSDQQSQQALELDLRSKLGSELFELLHAVAKSINRRPKAAVDDFDNQTPTAPGELEVAPFDFLVDDTDYAEGLGVDLDIDLTDSHAHETGGHFPAVTPAAEDDSADAQWLGASVMPDDGNLIDFELPSESPPIQPDAKKPPK